MLRKTSENQIFSFGESLFVQYIKRNMGVILIAIMVSVFMTILTYPGVLYSDSYERIRAAEKFKLWLHNLTTGNADLTDDQMWLTVIPSLFIYLSIECTGSMVLYTFAQCALFYCSILLTAKELTELNKKGMYIFILLTPVFLAYGINYEASVGCVSAILGMILIICKWNNVKLLVDRLASVVGIMFCAFIIFGFRANAFTILPVVIGIVFLMYKRNIKNIAAILLSILLGFGLSLYLPKALHVDTLSSYAAGFLWETVSTIQNMDGETQAFYSTYLDDIFGEGATQEALDKNTFAEISSANINSILNEPFDIYVISSNADEILSRYSNLIIQEPEYFFRTKCQFVCNTLGLKEPLDLREYYYDMWGRMGDYHFNDSRQRKYFVDYFVSYLEFMKLFRMPWLMFLMAFVLLAVWRTKFQGNPKEITCYDCLFFIALFYYGAYILNTQAFEFRYFFPSWVMLYLLIIVLTFNIGSRIEVNRSVSAVFMSGLVAFCLFGGYFKLTESGDAMIEEIEKNNQLVCSDAERKIYYGDGKLYFILNTSADKEYPFFLHYYTPDGEMINNDFMFSNNQIYTSFYRKKLAVKEIPMQKFSRMEVGQFYGGGVLRFWENQQDMSEFVNIPGSIDVADFNDDNWTNGYSNYENCFLAADVSLENCMLAGEKIVLQDGRATVITNTEVVGGYQRIYTADDLSVYGQRKYVIDK